MRFIYKDCGGVTVLLILKSEELLLKTFKYTSAYSVSMSKRAWWIAAAIAVLATSCASTGGNEVADVLGIIQTLFSSVGIVEPPLVSLVRIGIIVIIALIAAELGSLLGANKRIASIIGIILATISVLFIPSGLLVSMVATYTVVISTILVLAPNACLLFLVYGVIPGHTVFWEVLKLIILFIALILEGAALTWFS